MSLQSIFSRLYYVGRQSRILDTIQKSQRLTFQEVKKSASRSFSSFPDDIQLGLSDGAFIHGEVLDHAVDLRYSRPGDRIKVPYELTITDAMQVRYDERD